MCESFTKLADKVADERAEQTTVNNIKLMMKNMKCSLEDALNALEIKGKERAIIAKQLQKQAITKVAAGHISVTAAFFIFSK